MKRGAWLALVLGAAAAASAQPPPGDAVPEGVKVRRDIAYLPDGHERHRLDLYTPANGPGPWPVIAWVHGGAWMGGSKEGVPALPFVAKGYAVASINYRLSQHAVFPAQIEDCQAAIRWLRANSKAENLDPDHIGAWGASAGGHLVALMGTSGDVADRRRPEGEQAGPSCRVQAAVDFFGPTDFLQINAHAVPGGNRDHDLPTAPEGKLIGGAVQENPEKVAAANPITFVTQDDAPFLIVHGEVDPLVTPHQSKILHDALRKAKVESLYLEISGAGHGGPEFDSVPIRAAILAFFDRHLKPQPGAGPSGQPQRRPGGPGGPGGPIVLNPDDKPAFDDPPASFRTPREGIPHGKLELVEYDSKSVGTRRKLNVYTPPGYSADRKYPVLYLLHGIGGDETEWQRFCTPGVILDNLIADGQAAPMIVVMPNGRAQKDDRPRGNIYAAAPAFAAFEADLFGDVIPWVEAHYSVAADREHRGLAGLSMGGGQSLNFGLRHLDRFAWVGGFSSAPNTMPPAELVPDPAAARSQLKLLWLACGNKDGLLRISQGLHAYLKERDVPHVWHVDSHGHDATEWGKNFYLFAQRIFR